MCPQDTVTDAHRALPGKDRAGRVGRVLCPLVRPMLGVGGTDTNLRPRGCSACGDLPGKAHGSGATDAERLQLWTCSTPKQRLSPPPKPEKGPAEGNLPDAASSSGAASGVATARVQVGKPTRGTRRLTRRLTLNGTANNGTVLFCTCGQPPDTAHGAQGHEAEHTACAERSAPWFSVSFGLVSPVLSHCSQRPLELRVLPTGSRRVLQAQFIKGRLLPTVCQAWSHSLGGQGLRVPVAPPATTGKGSPLRVPRHTAGAQSCLGHPCIHVTTKKWSSDMGDI